MFNEDCSRQIQERFVSKNEFEFLIKNLLLSCDANILVFSFLSLVFIFFLNIS